MKGKAISKNQIGADLFSFLLMAFSLCFIGCSSSEDSNASSKNGNLAGLWSNGHTRMYIDEEGNSTSFTTWIETSMPDYITSGGIYLDYDGWARFKYFPSEHKMQVTDSDGAMMLDVFSMTSKEIVLVDSKTNESMTLMKCGERITTAPASIRNMTLYCKPTNLFCLSFEANGTVDEQSWYKDAVIDYLSSSYTYTKKNGNMGEISYALTFRLNSEKCKQYCEQYDDWVRKYDDLTIEINGKVQLEFLTNYNEGGYNSYFGRISGEAVVTRLDNNTGEVDSFKEQTESMLFELVGNQ